MLLLAEQSPSRKLMERWRTEGENLSTLRWWSVPADGSPSFNDILGQVGWSVSVIRCHCKYAIKHSHQCTQQWSNRGIQISLHIDLRDCKPMGDQYSGIWSFPLGGAVLVWNSRKALSGEFGQIFSVWGMCTEICLCITDSIWRLIILIHHGCMQLCLFTYANCLLITCGFHFNIYYLFLYLF